MRRFLFIKLCCCYLTFLATLSLSFRTASFHWKFTTVFIVLHCVKVMSQRTKRISLFLCSSSRRSVGNERRIENCQFSVMTFTQCSIELQSDAVSDTSRDDSSHLLVT